MVFVMTNLWGYAGEGSFVRVTTIDDFQSGYYVITGLGEPGQTMEGIYAMSNALGGNNYPYMWGVRQYHIGDTITNPDMTIVWYIENVAGNVYAIREAGGQRYYGLVYGETRPLFEESPIGLAHHWVLGWDNGLITFMSALQNIRYLRFRPDLTGHRFNNVHERTAYSVNLTLYRYLDPSNGGGTLSATLSSFAASVVVNEGVSINWATDSESGMRGFHVLRQEYGESPTRVTPNLIAATNTSTIQTYRFMDRDVQSGREYYYWIQSLSNDGSTELFGPVFVSVVQECITHDISATTMLSSVYPNPLEANSQASFHISVKQAETATLKIFNIKGQLVREFSNITAGNHTLVWDGKDMNNNLVGSGVYLYKLTSPSVSTVQRMKVVR